MILSPISAAVFFGILITGPSVVRGWHECPEDDKYIGNISVTDGGRLCQKWQVRSPHYHGFVDDYYFYLDGTIEEAENYCRNTGWDHVWCYTTDPEVETEYCHERVCGDKSPSCQDGTNLHQYSGKVSVTDGARTCQQWSEQAPHAHPFNTSEFFPLDDSVEGAVNYCRNVGGDGAPWCFTTDPRVRWQYCYEQICNDTSPSCGGTLTNGSGLIESIDRDGDGRRDAYRDCLWTIIAPDNMTIEIQLVMVDFNPAGNDGFIEIYGGNEQSALYYNGSDPVARFQTSVLHVRIHTWITYGEAKGVKIRYSFVLNELNVMNSTMTPVTMATEAEGLSTPASAAGRQFNRIVLAQIMGAVLSVFVRSIELSGLHG